MAHHIEIPDSIASSLRLPEHEIEPRLRTELALALYAREILSFGKASELADLSPSAFAEQLSARGVPRHYTEEDLAQDLAYARHQ
jgi:predicted HTH domain antitoxin